jgi:hypothetical protein
LANNESTIFAGTVLYRKEAVNGTGPVYRLYVVSVDSVIKGCSLNNSELIAVSTTFVGTGCGVPIVVNNTLFFSGTLRKLDNESNNYWLWYGLDESISSTIHSINCNFHALVEDVTTEDRNMLYDYAENENKCTPNSTDDDDDGIDCPSNFFCKIRQMFDSFKQVLQRLLG